MTIDENCWFCKTRPASEQDSAIVKMERVETFPSGNWDLKATSIGVPRCQECKKAHGETRVATVFGWILAALVGVVFVGSGFVFFLSGYSGPVIIPIKPVGLLLLLLLVVFPFVGVPVLIGVFGSLNARSLFLGSALLESKKRTFDVVERHKAQGWVIPSQICFDGEGR